MYSFFGGAVGAGSDWADCGDDFKEQRIHMILYFTCFMSLFISLFSRSKKSLGLGA